MYEGIINIDKPQGITSHDVVDRVRKKFKMRRVGHAGTLDPLATGVLVILVGKATKLSEQLMGFDKGYDAKLLLGVKTDTLDTDGKIIKETKVDVSREQVQSAIEKYKGDIDQMVPMYSAVKVNGRKLYEYARQGLAVERPIRRVTLHQMDLIDFTLPYIDISVDCSKGTYIRQLAEDIGDDLGCGACIAGLRRTYVGPFSVEESINLEDLDEKNIRDWSTYQTA